MHLHRRHKIQLAIFTVIAMVYGAVMVLGYMKLPAKMFGIGRYTVTMELPRAGGLYPTGNVTYRGTEVGRVESVSLADDGRVHAVLSLKSGIDIPSDLRAEVHSQSAIGEQYVELLPRSENAPALRQGDVIPFADTFVPPDINSLLDAATAGLQAIPRESLRTAVDEAYLAVGGLGPELSRLIKGSTAMASDARAHLDSLTRLIDQWQPVVDSQTDTADEITAWAARLAVVTDELRSQDDAVAGFIEDGGPAAAEAQQLFDRLRPTVPLVLANLVAVGQVAVTYQPSIEQLLVLLPQGIASLQGIEVANAHTKSDYGGAYLSFNLNINLPPACTTGFLPAQQRRSPSLEDYPEPPAGNLYCRVPQDSVFNVRGARNLPCIAVPGKRAPTVMQCESDEQYVPLNDGFNWKGDPNATLIGQGVPELPAAEYDPATGEYVAPDGQPRVQANLARRPPEGQSWQSMLVPPK